MSAEAYTIAEVAHILDCAAEKVVEKIKDGDVPGLKWGRGWIVPREALSQRLNELALQEAHDRRKARNAGTVAVKVIAAAQASTNKPRRQARTPPTLPHLPQAQLGAHTSAPPDSQP